MHVKFTKFFEFYHKILHANATFSLRTQGGISTATLNFPQSHFSSSASGHEVMHQSQALVQSVAYKDLEWV